MSGEQEGQLMTSIPSASRSFLHTGHMRPSIVLHQEQPKAHHTSLKSNKWSEYFITVPNSSQGNVGYVTVPWSLCDLQGFASPNLHWPTAKPAMLDDVTSSKAFTMASPDSFMGVTCAQYELPSICKENGAPITDLTILVFSHECQSSCPVLGCEPAVYWKSLCWVLAVLLLFLLA